MQATTAIWPRTYVNKNKGKPRQRSGVEQYKPAKQFKLGRSSACADIELNPGPYPIPDYNSLNVLAFTYREDPRMSVYGARRLLSDTLETLEDPGQYEIWQATNEWRILEFIRTVPGMEQNLPRGKTLLEYEAYFHAWYWLSRKFRALYWHTQTLARLQATPGLCWLKVALSNERPLNPTIGWLLKHAHLYDDAFVTVPTWGNLHIVEHDTGVRLSDVIHLTSWRLGSDEEPDDWSVEELRPITEETGFDPTYVQYAQKVADLIKNLRATNHLLEQEEARAVETIEQLEAQLADARSVIDSQADIDRRLGEAVSRNSALSDEVMATREALRMTQQMVDQKAQELEATIRQQSSSTGPSHCQNCEDKQDELDMLAVPYTIAHGALQRIRTVTQFNSTFDGQPSDLVTLWPSQVANHVESIINGQTGFQGAAQDLQAALLDVQLRLDARNQEVNRLTGLLTEMTNRYAQARQALSAPQPVQGQVTAPVQLTSGNLFNSPMYTGDGSFASVLAWLETHGLDRNLQPADRDWTYPTTIGRHNYTTTKPHQVIGRLNGWLVVYDASRFVLWSCTHEIFSSQTIPFTTFCSPPWRRSVWHWDHRFILGASPNVESVTNVVFPANSNVPHNRMPDEDLLVRYSGLAWKKGNPLSLGCLCTTEVWIRMWLEGKSYCPTHWAEAVRTHGWHSRLLRAVAGNIVFQSAELWRLYPYVQMWNKCNTLFKDAVINGVVYSDIIGESKGWFVCYLARRDGTRALYIRVKDGGIHHHAVSFPFNVLVLNESHATKLSEVHFFLEHPDGPNTLYAEHHQFNDDWMAANQPTQPRFSRRYIIARTRQKSLNFMDEYVYMTTCSTYFNHYPAAWLRSRREYEVVVDVRTVKRGTVREAGCDILVGKVCAYNPNTKPNRFHANFQQVGSIPAGFVKPGNTTLATIHATLHHGWACTANWFSHITVLTPPISAGVAALPVPPSNGPTAVYIDKSDWRVTAIQWLAPLVPTFLYSWHVFYIYLFIVIAYWVFDRDIFQARLVALTGNNWWLKLADHDEFITESNQPTHTAVDPRMAVQLVTMGSRGDRLPVQWMATLCARIGIPCHIWNVCDMKAEELGDVANGDFSHAAWPFFDMLFSGMYRYKMQVMPHVVGLPSTFTYTLAPSREWVPELSFGDTFLGKCAAYVIRRLRFDARVGVLRGSTLPRGITPKKLLERVPNRDRIHRSAWTAGSDSVELIPKEVRDKCYQLPNDGTDHSLIIPEFSVVHTTGAAGIRDTTLACGARHIGHTTVLDRNLAKEPTQQDLVEPSAALFIGALVYHGFDCRLVPLHVRAWGLVWYLWQVKHRLLIDYSMGLLQIWAMWKVFSTRWSGTLLSLLTIPSFAGLVHMVAPFVSIWQIFTFIWEWPAFLLLASKVNLSLYISLAILGIKRILHEYTSLRLGRTFLLVEKMESHSWVPFPFGHVSLYNPSENEVFEGVFTEKPGIGEPFRLVRQIRKPRKNHYLVPAPFDPAALRKIAPVSSSALYSFSWNCTQTAFVPLLQTGGVSLVCALFLMLTSGFFLLPPALVRAAHKATFDSVFINGVSLAQLVAFAANTEEHEPPMGSNTNPDAPTLSERALGKRRAETPIDYDTDDDNVYDSNSENEEITKTFENLTQGPKTSDNQPTKPGESSGSQKNIKVDENLPEKIPKVTLNLNKTPENMKTQKYGVEGDLVRGALDACLNSSDSVYHETLRALKRDLGDVAGDKILNTDKKDLFKLTLRAHAWFIAKAIQDEKLDYNTAIQVALTNLADILINALDPVSEEMLVGTLGGGIVLAGSAMVNRVRQLINQINDSGILHPALEPIRAFLRWLSNSVLTLGEFFVGTIAALVDIAHFLQKVVSKVTQQVWELAGILVDHYLPVDVARRLKSVWALSNLQDRNPYLSARNRLLAQIAYCTPRDRTTANDDWGRFIADLKRHGDKVGAGHTNDIGQLQFKAVNIGKPMLSHDQAEALGFSREEYENDPNWEKMVNALRDEGVPIGCDATLWADKNPESMLKSAARYAPRQEPLSSDDAKRADQIADALVDMYPDVFKGGITSVRGAMKYMEHNNHYRPGPPFYSVGSYTTREAMLKDGWDKAIESYIMEQLRMGIEDVGWLQLKVKNQVVDLEKIKAGKNVRTVSAQSYIQVVKHLMFQGPMSKNYDWKTTGFGMGMPNNHEMVSLFDKIADNIDPNVDPKSQGGSLLLSDCSEYDSTTGPFGYRMLGRIVDRAYADVPNGKAAASHVKARYRNLSTPNSWLVAVNYKDAAEGEQTTKFLEKNRGGGTGEATTTWTNTVGYRGYQIAIIWRATDYRATLKEILEAYVAGNTGDDTFGSLKGWFLNKFGLAEPHPKRPNTFRLSPYGASKLEEAGAYHGLKVIYEGVEDIEDVIYLSKLVREPNDEDQKDINRWRDAVEASTGIRPPMPKRILYHDVSGMNLRRQSLPYNKLFGRAIVTQDMLGGASLAREFAKKRVDIGSIPSWLLGKIQQTMGHSALMAFNPDYYVNVANEHITWYNQAASLGGFARRTIVSPQGRSVKIPVATLQFNPRSGRPYVAYDFDESQALTHRQVALFKVLKNSRVQAYDKLVTTYFRPPKAGAKPGVKPKILAKFEHFFDTPTERTAGFLEALDNLYSAIPKQVTKFLPGTGVWNAPAWETKHMYLEIGLALCTGEDDPAQLHQLTKEHPYSVCMAIDPFIARMSLDPNWWDRQKHLAGSEAMTVRAYKNYHCFVTIIYGLIYLVEALIYGLPWIGLGYRILMFAFINFTKTYTIMNNIYWHSQLRSSRDISALIPRDIYMWSKRFSEFVASYIFSIPYMPLVFAFMPWYLFPELVAKPMEVFACWVMKGNNAINADKGTRVDTMHNPWTPVATSTIPVALREGDPTPPVLTTPDGAAIPTQMIGITAGTGTGKSSWFVRALLDEMNTRADMREKRIWLLVPRIILRDTASIPNLVENAGFQRLKKDVVLDTQTRVAVATYGHALGRVDQINNGDIVLLDEAGERDGNMIAILHKLRNPNQQTNSRRLRVLIYHLTATPIPLVSLPETANSIVQWGNSADRGLPQPRFPRRVLTWEADPIQRWIAACQPNPMSEDEQPEPLTNLSGDMLEAAKQRNKDKEKLIKARILAAKTRPMFIFSKVETQAKPAADELSSQFRRNVVLVTRETVRLYGRENLMKRLQTADCIVGSQILTRGFDDPIGATATFIDHKMIAQHQGELRSQVTSRSEMLQGQGRSGRKMPGLDVRHPLAGTGPEPTTYPTATLLTAEHSKVATEFGLRYMKAHYSHDIGPAFTEYPYVQIDRAKLSSNLGAFNVNTLAEGLQIAKVLVLWHILAHEGIEQRSLSQFWSRNIWNPTTNWAKHIYPEDNVISHAIIQEHPIRLYCERYKLTPPRINHLLNTAVLTMMFSEHRRPTIVTQPRLPIKGKWRPVEEKAEPKIKTSTVPDLDPADQRILDDLLALPEISVSSIREYFANRGQNPGQLEPPVTVPTLEIDVSAGQPRVQFAQRLDNTPPSI